MNIIDINKNYNSVSIVGMNKNVGKTQALNYFIKRASEEGISLALTSTGRDGESEDLVTNTKKPEIYVYKGTLIATGEKLLNKKTPLYEIVEITNSNTPFGKIVIIRVLEDGFIEIAGPNTNNEIKKLNIKLKQYGAELIFVDGAINRKTSASPSITDATILSTGAVVSRNMNTMIKETIYEVDKLKISPIDDFNIKDIILNNLNNSLIINNDYSYKKLNVKTSLAMGNAINEEIRETSSYIYIKGALTKKTIEDIIKSNKDISNIVFVIEDGTKIFISRIDFYNFLKRGLNLRVLNEINLITITINPFSPKGYYYNPFDLKKLLKKEIEVPIINVLLEEGD